MPCTLMSRGLISSVLAAAALVVLSGSTPNGQAGLNLVHDAFVQVANESHAHASAAAASRITTPDGQAGLDLLHDAFLKVDHESRAHAIAAAASRTSRMPWTMEAGGQLQPVSVVLGHQHGVSSRWQRNSSGRPLIGRARSRLKRIGSAQDAQVRRQSDGADVQGRDGRHEPEAELQTSSAGNGIPATILASICPGADCWTPCWNCCFWQCFFDTRCGALCKVCCEVGTRTDKAARDMVHKALAAK